MGNLTGVTTRSRDLTIRLAAALLLLTGVVGCSDDGAPEGDPGPSSGTASETGSSTPDEPTDEPSPTVSPASGDAVRYRQFSLRAPKGWKVGENLLWVRSIRSPPGPRQVRTGEPFGSITISAGPAIERSLRQLAQEEVADYEGKRVADTILDGEIVYHVAKPDPTLQMDEVYGLWRDGQNISIRFSLSDAPLKKRRALIESVLTTWEWRQ